MYEFIVVVESGLVPEGGGAERAGEGPLARVTAEVALQDPLGLGKQSYFTSHFVF